MMQLFVDTNIYCLFSFFFLQILLNKNLYPLKYSVVWGKLEVDNDIFWLIFSRDILNITDIGNVLMILIISEHSCFFSTALTYHVKSTFL